MSRIRAVFLGTPEIARICLEAMIKDEHFEVVGVVSQPDRPAGRKMQLQPSPVKALVQPLGIPVLTPESINKEAAIKTVISWRAEVAVVVAFGQLLSQKFLDLFPQRIVNVHASLLPRWRGAAPVQRALMAGDLETGVSLQMVVKRMDAGPILGYRKIPLTPETNAIEVFQQVAVLGSELISLELMDYLRGHLSLVPQDEGGVLLAPKIDKAEAVIDWRWPAERIHNLVRGLAAGPVALTTRNGAVVKIHRTRIADRNGAVAGGATGQLEPSGLGLQVVCGQGRLEILTVQPESRAAMSAADYLRGYPIRQGDAFGSNGSVPRRA